MFALFAVALAAVATAAGPPRFRIEEAAPGVFAAIADPADSRTRGNAGFVVGTDAVLVVDTFASEEAAERLLSEIRSRTKLPVRFAALTHFHSDHMGGAAVFARAGAVVLAQAKVHAWAKREWQPGLDE